VRWVLANRWKTIAVSSVVMVLSFSLARLLPTGFSPAQDYGFVNLNVELPPGARLAAPWLLALAGLTGRRLMARRLMARSFGKNLLPKESCRKS
jgi:hypothetical protein